MGCRVCMWSACLSVRVPACLFVCLSLVLSVCSLSLEFKYSQLCNCARWILNGSEKERKKERTNERTKTVEIATSFWVRNSWVSFIVHSRNRSNRKWTEPERYWGGGLRWGKNEEAERERERERAVSYTHLTLPTRRTV